MLMRRRLYFVLPDIESARTMLNDMLLARIECKHIHFLAQRGTLPARSARGERVAENRHRSRRADGPHDRRHRRRRGRRAARACSRRKA